MIKHKTFKYNVVYKGALGRIIKMPVKNKKEVKSFKNKLKKECAIEKQVYGKCLTKFKKVEKR